MEINIDHIRNRFGLTVKSHRIGELELKVAQVERVDEMVYEIYPDAVMKHGDAPVWMITWPAAFGLAEYLLLNSKVSGLRVLELGCGTAAPGIALEKGGASVISTDYDHYTLALAVYNARLNNCSSIEFRYLDWHDPRVEGSFDLVIGSDIVYFEKSFMPLISVLRRYALPGGEIILSDQGRPQMDSFLKICSGEGFAWREERQIVHLPDVSRIIRIIILRSSK